MGLSTESTFEMREHGNDGTENELSESLQLLTNESIGNVTSPAAPLAA